MKKHEKIKFAYDNYPKGTNVKWGDRRFESSGIFLVSDGCVLDDTANLIFDVDDGWAEIVNPSILDGKVVIEVNSTREQEIVNNYFGSTCILNVNFPHYLTTTMDGFFGTKDIANEEGYNTISFADFAKEFGIKVPVFTMKSEDGVDLYEGDEASHVCNFNGRYEYNGLFKVSGGVVGHVFSTKEAAEKWIEEQNKPLNIEIKINDSNLIDADVHRSVVVLNKKHGGSYKISSHELTEIWYAFQSLQCDKPVSS